MVPVSAPLDDPLRMDGPRQPPIFFGNWARSDPLPMRHNETTFRFLDRVDDPYFAAVRAVINDWIARYPQPNVNWLMTRLRSESEQEQMGAWWELYLYDVMTAAGWAMELEPEVLETPNRPDFLARRPPGAFYLEATSSNPSIQKVAEQNRLAAVLEFIANTQISGFFLDVHWDRIGPGSPSVGGLREELTRWLGGLSREQVLADYARGGVFALPTRTWSKHGWKVSFMAYPWGERALTRSTRLPTLGAEGPGYAEIVDQTSPMERAFKAKHKRYGSLPDPFVLAYVSRGDHPATELTFLNALLGPLRGGPDGCWYARGQPINQDISAVIAGYEVRPSNFLRVIPSVFTNPWAITPFKEVLPWPTVVLAPDGSESQRDAGKPLHALLGLPPEWPGIEPFSG
jgi:hypothetical protein